MSIYNSLNLNNYLNLKHGLNMRFQNVSLSKQSGSCFVMLSLKLNFKRVYQFFTNGPIKTSYTKGKYYNYLFVKYLVDL